jgi:MATE family multidrug resistance protein
VRQEVAVEAIAYGEVLTWSLLPLLVFTALRRYLQATNRVKPIMAALVTANVMNAAIAWVLIFGRLGFPAMGVRGAGWATVVSRVYLCLFVVGYIAWCERRESTGIAQTPLRLDRQRLTKLVRLGLPAALQVTLEVGVFVTSTTIVGTLDPIWLAAHQIALNAASFTFMIPLGIASAAAVRVGQAVGRRDAIGAQASGWAAILLGAGVMTLAGLTFVFFPAAIIRVFTNDTATIAAGVTLLGVAAVFQLFDGVQVVSTGALRGLGNTRTPMLTNLIGHWVIGLPLGWYLAFRAGAGVLGVWFGLCTGLIIVALVLLTVWARESAAARPHL